MHAVNSSAGTVGSCHSVLHKVHPVNTPRKWSMIGYTLSMNYICMLFKCLFVNDAVSCCNYIYCQWGMNEWVWSTGAMVLTGIQQIYWVWSRGAMVLTRIQQIYLDKTVSVSLCPPQTLHVLPDNHWFGAPQLRGQEVTACTMAQLPAGLLCCALNVILHGRTMPYCYEKSKCWFYEGRCTAVMWGGTTCWLKNI